MDIVNCTVIILHTGGNSNDHKFGFDLAPPTQSLHAVH